MVPLPQQFLRTGLTGLFMLDLAPSSCGEQVGSPVEVRLFSQLDRLQIHERLFESSRANRYFKWDTISASSLLVSLEHPGTLK